MLNDLIARLRHHSVEVWIGIVCAIIFAIPAAIVYDWWKEFKGIKYIQKKIRQIFCGNEKIIQRSEIDNTTKSKFPLTVPHNQIAAVIEVHEALVTRAPFYYTNLYKKYRTQRLLKVLRLLNGQDSFFSELCKAMSASLPPNGFDLCLSLNKETNRLFATEFGRNLIGRVRSQHIVYAKPFWRRDPKFKYEQGDSLQGVKVILLESFLLFPESLTQTIEWLHSQGAIISKVVMLFASMEDQALISSCGIKAADVIVGCSIDLGLTASLTDTPPQPTGRPIVLKYCNY